jgi:serine/threonine protein kinase
VSLGALPEDGRLDGYKLLQCLSSSARGEVWRASAPGDIPVAVKMLFRPFDPEEAPLEQRWLEVVRQLHHPNLLQMHAVWSLPDRLVLATDLADGSLHEYARWCRALGLAGVPAPELLTFLKEVANALDYLHGQGIRHGNVKPRNILLASRHAKLADFGLARIRELSKHSTGLTQAGTPAYMAPEVWRGQGCAASDQYALAVSYAELRLARLLFAGRDMAAVMYAHLEGTPNLEPLAAAEQQVLRRALAKDPAGRYPNCLALVQALERAAPGELSRWGGLLLWILLGLIAVVVGVVAVLRWF